MVFVFVVCTLGAQTTKTYDCEWFTLEYSSSYKLNPNIKGHALVRMETPKEMLAVSLADLGFNQVADIWDDEFINRYKQNSTTEKGHTVSLTKVSLETKNGSIRALKKLANIKKGTLSMKVLSYVLLHENNLLIFTFASEGMYKADERTPMPEKFMKGLALKYKTSATQDEFKNKMIESIKTLNAQCPIQVDECTSYQQVLLAGKTITIKTVVPSDCYDFLDFDVFKQRLTENFSMALERSFILYLKKEGFGLAYMIYDENDKFKKRIAITADDMLSSIK